MTYNFAQKPRLFCFRCAIGRMRENTIWAVAGWHRTQNPVCGIRFSGPRRNNERAVIARAIIYEFNTAGQLSHGRRKRITHVIVMWYYKKATKRPVIIAHNNYCFDKRSVGGDNNKRERWRWTITARGGEMGCVWERRSEGVCGRHLERVCAR